MGSEMCIRDRWKGEDIGCLASVESVGSLEETPQAQATQTKVSVKGVGRIRIASHDRHTFGFWHGSVEPIEGLSYSRSLMMICALFSSLFPHQTSPLSRHRLYLSPSCKSSSRSCCGSMRARRSTIQPSCSASRSDSTSSTLSRRVNFHSGLQLTSSAFFLAHQRAELRPCPCSNRQMPASALNSKASCFQRESQMLSLIHI